MSRPLYEVDPEVALAIDNETRRQHEGLELIASENFVSDAVLEAMGSVFTNKYAEGYPGKRYYGGCEYADVVENLARDRAQQLFGAEHVNVQPQPDRRPTWLPMRRCCSPATRFSGLNLAHGGHLTHGHHLTFYSQEHLMSFPYRVTKERKPLTMTISRSWPRRLRPKLPRWRRSRFRGSSTSPACAASR